MIYFFDKALSLIEVKNEVSFSFSKKANKEGSGKIELAELPNKEAVYVAIYTEEMNQNTKTFQYVASGFIAEVQINLKNISITFNTFESILKNYKLPKVFNNFQSLPLATIFSNLFYSYVPILKSKKKDFSSITSGYDENAEIAHGVLSAAHIEFGKIKDGDLHLAFNKDYEAKNEYRYYTEGAIVFWFDLGDNHNYYNHFYDHKNLNITEAYPQRFLRFTASLGSKTIINVKAIEQDECFDKNNIETINEAFKKAEYLPFDRSKKDFEKKEGVKLPSEKRFLAIQFIFIYENPDWVQDYSTLEVYNGAGSLEKRTVRGFTPVLHGFEILTRKDIPPFNFAKINFYLSSIVEKEEITQKVFSFFNSKIKFDGLTLYDAMTKLLDETKYNLTIDLKIDVLGNPQLFIKMSKNDFNPIRIKKKLNEYIDDSHIFRLHEGEATRLNNYILKSIKKKTENSKMLHYYGEGEGQDVLYICLYNTFIQNPDNSLKEVLNAYLPDKIDESTEEGKLLKDLNIVQQTQLPSLSFIEERVEDSNIKDFNTLLKKATEHFLEAQKKENYSFEIESNLNVSLYDKVLLLYSKNKLQLKANIVEIKISKKASKLHQTYGIGGFLFNPFDSLFQKPQIVELFKKPCVPFNLRAFTCNKQLNIAWDCLGGNDGYVIEVRRLDGKDFSKARPQKEVYFFSESTEISLTSFKLKTLYCLNVCSYIRAQKSEKSITLYFKINDGNIPIRILTSLDEAGSNEGEKGFYLNEYKRESYKEKLITIFNTKEEKIKELNDISNVFLPVPLKDLHEDDFEILHSYLGNTYVWQNKEWYDVRIRLPEIPPTFYFNFRNIYVLKNYKKETFETLLLYFSKLKSYEQARQTLNYLSFRYVLPPESSSPIYYMAKGNTLPKHPIEPPIENPDPPFPPNYPEPDPGYKPGEPPSFDKRETPTDYIIAWWDWAYFIYEQSQKDLSALKYEVSRVIRNDELFSQGGNILDLSQNENHLNFSAPIFECLKNVWDDNKKDFPFLIRHNNDKKFLDTAFRFYWQSTIKDGSFRWEAKKPIFNIKQLKTRYEDIGSGAKNHTLAFWLKVNSLAGDVELWNIGNYDVGLIKDGVLHFGFKMADDSFYTFFKLKLLHDPLMGITPKYIHVMVLSFFDYIAIPHFSNSGDWYKTYSLTVEKKIFINFNEIKINEYENKINKINIQKYEDIFNKPEYEASFFNFKEKSHSEEDYSNFSLHAVDSYYYKKSPHFDVCLSHLMMFHKQLDYGERQFLKANIKLPIIEEEKKQIKAEEVIQGKLKKDSKYKGLCVGTVDKNVVVLYEKGEQSFNAEDFFLMGHNRISEFTAGVLYKWMGTSWQELKPYSLYHKEYLQAYQDCISLKTFPPDVFFKDFIMSALQIADVFYSKNVQTNLLTVQEGFCLNNIPKEDPHVAGQVYLVFDPINSIYVLTVSEG